MLQLRQATERDIKSLVRLENNCFDQDRLNARNFRWMIQRGHTSLVMAESPEGELAGYILTLFHSGTSLARIYSLAISAEMRQQGVANLLLEAAEEEARLRRAIFIRLEVRFDNATAIRLYERRGYRKFGLLRDYYEDHADAFRYEKRIYFPPPQALMREIPYYAQSTDFTCGPACLMMAFKAFDSDTTLDRRLELQLWREATIIFMSSGHGGCGPHGLALAAARRGFRVELFINQDGPLFLEGVRSEGKKEVMRIVHEDFVEQLKTCERIQSHIDNITLELVREQMEQGRIPLVMISSYRISHSKVPHWVVVSAIDDHFIYLHDSDIDPDLHKTETDHVFVPVPLKEFEKMFKFGQVILKTALFIER